MEDPILRKAQKRVKSKKGFYTHLAVFVSVGIFFLLLNLVTYEGEMWFFFPLLPWMVGVLIHYFTNFGFPGTEIMNEGWEERQLEKEVRDILQKEGRLRRTLSEHSGELPPAQEGLELPDLEKTKEKQWSDRDFV